MSDLRDTLKPCPFCGGEAAFNKVTYSELMVKDQGWDQDTFHGVNCISCGVSNLGIVGHKDQEGAAVKWNTRAALAQPEAVEPVAWRVKNDFGHWYATMDRALAMTWRNTERLEVQPLFTTPPLAPDERMRRALEKIAGSHWERVGYCQSDVDDVPDLTAEEAMREAREALSRADEAKDKELAELRAEERESFQKYVDANEARIETEARAETAERRVAELEEENEALQDQNASAVIVTNWFDLGRELNVPEGGSVFDTVMALKRERDEAREALKLTIDALNEAEAILGGEYGDHYGPLCEKMMALKDGARAITGEKQ